MESKTVESRIDEAANAAKRAVAKLDETQQIAGELAGAAIATAQDALTQASKKGEHRLSEAVSKAAHRMEETVAKLANRAEEWADEITASGKRASRKRTQNK